MKKFICLFIVLACITSQAQTLRMMKIYRSNGTTDTTSLSRIDSVTIENSQTNFVIHLKTGQLKTRAISGIDSIMWPYVNGPAYDITKPNTPGQIFHVGDTIEVIWNYNPAPCGAKAWFQMSTDGGTTWKWLTDLVCYMMYKDSIYAGTPCTGGINYVAWPYVVTNGKYVGTWKFKISNPMAMPDAMADVFNPISDSVIIKLHDYENSEVSYSPMFKIQP
jgi:hypothetical protein